MVLNKLFALVFTVSVLSSCVSANEDGATDPDSEAVVADDGVTDADVDKALEEVGGPVEEATNEAVATEEAVSEKVEAIESEDIESYKLDDANNKEPIAENEALEAPLAEEKKPELDLAPSEPVKEEVPAVVEEPVRKPSAVSEEPSVDYASSDKVLYAVRPGESLSMIAKRLMGSVKGWKALARANNIKNPNHIRVGAIIEIGVTEKNRKTVSAYVAKYSRTVKVKKGDTLAKIAKRVLSSGKAWKYLWKNNESVVTDPNRIEIGTTLSYLAAPKSSGIAKKTKPENATH